MKKEIEVALEHRLENLLKDRKKENYRNEYDRLRGIIAHSILPQGTKENIERRMKELEKFQLA